MRELDLDVDVFVGLSPLENRLDASKSIRNNDEVIGENLKGFFKKEILGTLLQNVALI